MSFKIGMKVCGAMLAAFALGSGSSTLHAQGCGCGGGGISSGMYFESMPIEGEVVADDAAKLMEIDDPAKIINLSVIVHEKAIVSINGEPTVTLGTRRPYIVRELTPGKTYKFEIEGVYKTEQGAEYADKEVVTLKAGESKEVVLHVRRRNRAKPPVVPAAAPIAPVPVVAK